MSKTDRLRYGRTTYRIKRAAQSEWQKKLNRWGLWVSISGQKYSRTMEVKG